MHYASVIYVSDRKTIPTCIRDISCFYDSMIERTYCWGCGCGLKVWVYIMANVSISQQCAPMIIVNVFNLEVSCCDDYFRTHSFINIQMHSFLKSWMRNSHRAWRFTIRSYFAGTSIPLRPWCISPLFQISPLFSKNFPCCQYHCHRLRVFIPNSLWLFNILVWQIEEG